MSGTRSGTRAERTRFARLGAVAVFAQGVNSISNLMVGIVVARALGPGALGRFALLFTLLLALVAVQTAWVGDSLTVLDRGRASIRSGVANAQWAHTVLGSVAGGILAYTVGDVGVACSIAFAALVGVWELEEFGRRVFMARLDFWRQAANDGSYLIVTAVALATWWATATLTLTAILICMAIGALCAFLLGVWWLPGDERLLRPSPSSPGFREVAVYGMWRGAQSGAGYASQVIVRSLVIGMASAAVMGQLEAARLVFAPLFTLIGAATNLTLATFSRSERAAGRATSLLVTAAVAGLGSACVFYGAIVLSLPNVFVHLLAGSHFHADRVVLAGWFAVTLTLAVSTPFTTLALVVATASTVFYMRLAGSVAGVVLTAIALQASRPVLIPGALAVGVALSGIMLWRLSRTASARVAVEEGNPSLSAGAAPLLPFPPSSS